MTDRRTVLVLVLGMFGLTTLTMGIAPRTVDEWSAYWIAESLIDRGSFAVPQAPAMNMAYGRWGLGRRFYSPTEPLPSILMAPLLLVGKSLVSGLSPEAMYSYFVPGTLAAWSTALVTACSVALLYLLLRQWSLSPRASMATGVIYGVGTIAWPYGGFLFREPYLTLALLGALWFLGQWHLKSDERSAFFAGLCIAAGMWSKREVVFAVPALTLLALWPKGEGLRWRVLPRLAAGPTLGLLLLLAFNLSRFGDPFQLGYPTVDETGTRLVAFSTPIWVGLYGFLFSPGKSIFLFSPPLIIAAPALAYFAVRERHPLAVTSLVLVATNLLVFSTWSHWEGGWCWGPRHAVPWTPLLLIGLALLLDRHTESPRQRRLLVGGVAVVTAWGIVVQLLGSIPDYYAYAIASEAYIRNLNEYQLDFSPWWGHLQLLAQPGAYDLWWITLGREAPSPSWQWLSTTLLIFPLGSLIFTGAILMWTCAHRRPAGETPGSARERTPKSSTLA